MSEEMTREERLELYKQDPNSFYHIDDLTIAVTKRKEKGRQILVNTPSAAEMGEVMFLAQRHCNMMLDQIAMERSKNKILGNNLISKNGMRSFLRKK